MKIGITTTKDATVPLYIVDAEDNIASFDELNKRHFPMSELDARKVLPKFVLGKSTFSPLSENGEDKQPICVLQLNFIKGGLIIGVAIHHSCSDGPGADGFLTTWAESAAAAAKRKPFRPIDPANLDRSQLSASVQPSSVQWEQLDGKFPIWKDMKGPMPPPPPDFKMPALASRMWHFPAAALRQLKADASPAKESEDGAWISTYDAVVALIWKRVTLARLPVLNPGPDSESMLAHAFNTRQRMNPPLPDRFLGNATAVPRTDSIPVHFITEDDNLSRLATLVRKATNTITPQYLEELNQWVAGIQDRRWIVANSNNFLGMDFLASSWQSMNAYTKHDFGFGLPRALRWPNPPFEGYLFLFPSRAHLVGGNEGLEVCICLEEKTADRLIADEGMLKYAHPRL